MSLHGRVEPKRGPDSPPETCRSEALRDEISEHDGKDSSWPSPGLPEGHRKLTLAGQAHPDEVSFLAPPRTHTGGQQLTPSDPLESRHSTSPTHLPARPAKRRHAAALLPWLPPQTDDVHGLLANTSRATPAAPMALGQPA